jgi:hypothetical protein
MWFRSLLASWKSSPSRCLRPQPRRTPRGTRLILEHLECRSLPSTYSAANVTELIADINAANTAGGTNTITLTGPASSPYVLTAANNGTDGGNALPVISGGVISSSGNGKKVVKVRVPADNLTIIGNGDTIEGSPAPGGPSFRLFDVAGGAGLTLQNLTLTGGSVQAFLYYGQPIGGGAICNFGMLVLNGMTVSGNQVLGTPGTVWGDFVYISPGVSAVGGGIWSSGSLTLENGTLLENNAALGGDGDAFGAPPSGAMGGGLYVAGGTVNISNTTFSSNSATAGFTQLVNGASAFGGAIYVAAGSVTITTSTVTKNEAYANWIPGTSDGGGLYIANGAAISLDAFTVANTTGNYPNDISGSFTIQN